MQIHITPEELDRLEALAQAATPRPFLILFEDSFGILSNRGAGRTLYEVAYVTDGGFPPSERVANAAFITAACNAALPLIAAVRELQTRAERAEAEREELLAALNAEVGRAEMFLWMNHICPMCGARTHPSERKHRDECPHEASRALLARIGRKDGA